MTSPKSYGKRSSRPRRDICADVTDRIVQALDALRFARVALKAR